MSTSIISLALATVLLIVAISLSKTSGTNRQTSSNMQHDPTNSSSSTNNPPTTPKSSSSSSSRKTWSITKTPRHPLNLHEICETIFLLRQVLIPDLIPRILDEAEYWTVTSAARGSRPGDTSVRESTAGRAYVVAAVPAGLPAGSVRKMVFCTVSRDQGWSSYPESQGGYEASHTWFEVVVFEPDPYELARVVWGGSVTPASPRFGSGSGGIRIVTNIHAGKEWKKHDVVWTEDDEDQDVRALMARIKGGHRVAITAWAQYPGWVNNVSSASIDIYTPRVRRG